MTTNTSASAPSSQGATPAVITSEQLFSSIYNTLYAKHGHSDDPEEALSQLRALTRLISVSTDNEAEELPVHLEDIQWSLLLALDLIEEIGKRLEQHRAYHKSEREELKRLLDGCHLIPADPGTRILFDAEEVAP